MGVLHPSGFTEPAHERSCLRQACLLLALALAAAMAFAGNASAAVAGLERVSATSPNSSSDKSITVTCPAGKQVLGAGGQIVNGNGQVVLEDVTPNSGLTSVTVLAREDQNGQVGSWQVTAWATCAIAPLGLERVTATSPTNSSGKSAIATCPSGKRLLGTGADRSGGAGQVALNDVLPDSGLLKVTATALEDEDGTTANWSVRAYAICANPVAGRVRVTSTSPTNSNPKNAPIKPCPAGLRPTGAGGALTGGGGEVVLNHLLADSFFGAAAGGNEDEDGTSSNWSVSAYAICANVSERIAAASAFDSNNKTLSAPCADDLEPTGGGGDISSGSGQVQLKGFDRGFAFGEEGVNVYETIWHMRAYAICATPLPGAEPVAAASSFDMTSNKEVTVTCPAGKRVVGAGGSIEAPAGDSEKVSLHSARPNAALTSVTATGSERSEGPTWQVTARALCASAPPGLELVTAETEPDSDPASVTASCPAGKNLLGTGAELAGNVTSPFQQSEVGLDDVRPNAALTSVFVTGLEDDLFSNPDGEWFVRAHAICANP